MARRAQLPQPLHVGDLMVLRTVADIRRLINKQLPASWGCFFESGARIVEQTKLGDVRVSTVFLGVDHRHFGIGPPMVFETMIFGGPLDPSVPYWDSMVGKPQPDTIKKKLARERLALERKCAPPPAELALDGHADQRQPILILDARGVDACDRARRERDADLLGIELGPSRPPPRGYIVYTIL